MLTRGVFFVKFGEIDILLQAFTLNGMDTTITLSADKDLIQQARQQATSENTTLEALLLERLAHYVEQGSSNQYRDLMARLKHVQPGRQFSREEMNERGFALT